MKSRIDTLRVYHYFFSHLPDYRVNKNAAKAGAQITGPLEKAYQLKQKSVREPLLPELTQLWNAEDESAATRLQQFLFHDVLISVIIFQHRENHHISPEFFTRHTTIVDVPQPENLVTLGNATVFFARGRVEKSTVEYIVQVAFQQEAEERLPLCQFTWGTLYFLPALRRHILLLPETDGTGEGDSFLLSGFPVLEAVRRKIIFESGQSKRLSTDNFKTGYEIEHLLPSLLKKLGGEEESLPAAAQMSDRLNNLQNHLYNNISKMERTVYSIEGFIRYFEKHLATYPIKADILFQPLPNEFGSVKDHIERELKFTRFLFPGIEKLQEAVRLKFDLLRQRTLEKNNRLLDYQTTLMTVFAVAIGVGLILPDMNWIFKLLSMITSGAVTLVVLRYFRSS